MKDDMNAKSIAALDFMGEYGGLELEINDGIIVDHTFAWERAEAKK